MKNMERQKQLLSSIRKYLDLSQETIARGIGIALRSWWRWEQGITKPSQKNWQKILGLFKESARVGYKSKFLENAAFFSGIQHLGKTNEEIIKEIQKDPERVKHLHEKVFSKKNPKLKNLPFIEALDTYTKENLDADAVLLCTQIAEFILPETWKFPPKEIKKVKSVNIRKRDVRNRARASHQQQNKNHSNTKNTGDKESGGGDGDDPPSYKNSTKQPEPLPITIPQEGVKEYQELFRKKYDKEINNENAHKQFSDLFHLFNVVCRPISEK